MQNVPQAQLTPGNRRADRHVDIQHILTQGIDPALVLIVEVRLEAGVEHFPYRLDHRVRHGHVQIAATAIEFDVERSEEHTSELQSLMRISYAVFCLKKKK